MIANNRALFRGLKHLLTYKTNTYQVRTLHLSRTLSLFWEPDEKGGYKDNRKPPSTTQMIRDGLKELKSEINLWTQEVKEQFENDPILLHRPGETDVVWNFGSEESLNKWTVTNDRDNNEGYSTSSFTLSKEGNGLFCGNLSTRIPKDGKIKRGGYCNIRTIRPRVRCDKFH